MPQGVKALIMFSWLAMQFAGSHGLHAAIQERTRRAFSAAFSPTQKL